MANPKVADIEFKRRYTVSLDTLYRFLPYVTEGTPFTPPPFVKVYYIHIWVGNVTGSTTNPTVPIVEIVADRPMWGRQGFANYKYFGTYRYYDPGLTTWLLTDLDPDRIFLVYETQNR